MPMLHNAGVDIVISTFNSFSRFNYIDQLILVLIGGACIPLSIIFLMHGI